MVLNKLTDIMRIIILKNGMKGMMFWDYEGDDTMGTLRKALWNAVMKK